MVLRDKASAATPRTKAQNCPGGECTRTAKDSWGSRMLNDVISCRCKMRSDGFVSRRLRVRHTVSSSHPKSGRHIGKWKLTLVLSQSGCHSRMFLVRRSQRNIVQLKLSIQRSAADSEHSSSECFIASRLLENAQYGHAFQIGQGRGGEC